MGKQNIELTRFLPKGKAECEHKDGMLYMRTNGAIPTQRFDAEHLSINSYLYLPDKFKVPLRIDLRVRIDAPGFYVLFGKGHVNFGTLWSDNRRVDDIVNPARKSMHYHNHIEMNEFTDISLSYDRKEMQITINGVERYYSRKERYMKAHEFTELNQDGFELKIACDKLVNLCIQSVTITEYDDTCGIFHTEADPPAPIKKNDAVAPGEKPTFERCISLLPEDLRIELSKTDESLKSLRPLKFKRVIEKNGNKVTYVASEYGVSYAVYLSNDIFDHSLQWYIITNGKPETWHRKANRMEEVMNRLAVASPVFAERMFYQLEECVGCYKNCLAKTKYRLGDKQKAVCHGKLKFGMSVSGIEDVRTFIDELNRLIQETTM